MHVSYVRTLGGVLHFQPDEGNDVDPCCMPDNVQVFELHRFRADDVRGQAVIQLHTIPKKGQPQYKWIDLESPQEIKRSSSVTFVDDHAKTNRIHVRLEFSDKQEKHPCWALDVTLRGIGVSVIDCVSTRIAQELMFIHMMDVRVRYCSPMITPMITPM